MIILLQTTELLFSNVMAYFYYLANTLLGYLILIVVGMPVGGYFLMLVFKSLRQVLNEL